MSAESIARWNAIPMVRPETDQAVSYSLKRTRDQADDSDDDVSLISRSPSPRPADDAMDVDKYDEYVRGAEREVVTLDTKIGHTNRGFAMLAKLGWVEGQPLGLSGDGRVDPIPFVLKNDLSGLGKTSQDVRMIESTVSQRRGLDSERQTKETEEQRRVREESVAKRAAVQSEISSVLRPFYCELCDKQFQNVAQYDEHTNSYAHHHKARFRDMQAAQKAAFGSQEELEKRKEKERKREEKELRKMAKAVGIKMAKLSALSTATPAPAQSSMPVGEAAGGTGPSGFSKPGWATVGSTAQTQATVPPAPATRGGWAPTAQPPPPPPSDSAPPPPPVPSESAPHPSHHLGPAPEFRTGGWTSLDTGSVMAPPPGFASVPPVPPPAGDGGWAPSPPKRGGWATVSSAPEPPARGGWTSIPPAQAPPPSAPSVPPAQTRPRAEASRSGWQQFKAGGSRRR